MNLLDVEAVIIGGGLGVRFGDPYVEKIAKHMHPHLFVDERPPAMHVAALGDLGGAIGASLLFDDGYSRQSSALARNCRGYAADVLIPRPGVRGAISADCAGSAVCSSGSHGLRQAPWPASRWLAASGPQDPGS